MESWAQEVRTAMKESPDENEEVFPNDAEELRDYILTLEENMKHKPTDHLREELRVYKAYQTGWYKGVCFTYEYFIDVKEKERVREREDKIANNVIPWTMDAKGVLAPNLMLATVRIVAVAVVTPPSSPAAIFAIPWPKVSLSLL